MKNIIITILLLLFAEVGFTQWRPANTAYGARPSNTSNDFNTANTSYDFNTANTSYDYNPIDYGMKILYANAIEETAGSIGSGADLTAQVKDTYPFLYGNKRLWSGAGDSCIVLFRDSDSTQQTIGFLTSAVNSLVDTTAITTFLTGTTGRVVRWVDQSGNGNSAVQNTISLMPVWDNTVDSLQLEFDGVDDFLAIPDADNLSFGNSTTDNPLTIISEVNMTDGSNFAIISKGIYNTSGEYAFRSNSAKKLENLFMDESKASTYVGRNYNFTLSEGSWIYLSLTYDGSGGVNAEDGIDLYLDGTVVDNADTKAGTYTAMENLAHDVWVGRYTTSYAGGMFKTTMLSKYEFTTSQIQLINAYLNQ